MSTWSSFLHNEMPVNSISPRLKYEVERVFATLPHVYGGEVFARASCASAIRFVVGRFRCSVEEATDYIIAGCVANFKKYDGKTCLFFSFHCYVNSDEHFSFVFSRTTAKVTVEAHPLFANKSFYRRDRLESLSHNIATSVAFTRGHALFPKTGFIIVPFTVGRSRSCASELDQDILAGGIGRRTPKQSRAFQ